MPRTARVIVPNMPHHIVQRGHDRKAVFVEDCDYQYYLDNLREWKQALGINVYSYCLMTNHIHLIVEPDDETSAVSELMKRLAGKQTRLRIPAHAEHLPPEWMFDFAGIRNIFIGDKTDPAVIAQWSSLNL